MKYFQALSPNIKVPKPPRPNQNPVQPSSKPIVLKGTGFHPFILCPQ